MTRPVSLKRPLIVYPLALHLLTLSLSFAALLAVALRLDSGGPYVDEQVTSVIAGAIERDDGGRLAVRMTPELTALHASSPRLWFVAEDDAGGSIAFGEVPAQYASFVGRVAELSYAQLRDREAPHDLAAVVRQETSPAGNVTILAHGRLTEVGVIVVLASNVVVLPVFLLLAATSLTVTPWIVRRALAGVSRIAREAEQIDTSRRGRRLSENAVPTEIGPLVRAVNDALARLDEGYERQRRFIASAAHELRTPIAVIGAKVEAAATGEVRDLAGDVQRLATLVGQLLDLQRLDADVSMEPLDLGALVRGVAADLAPLLIASGKEIEVRIVDVRPCRGDAPALERVVANLVRNAIDHGGRRVRLRVVRTTFEVEDDGPGIPLAERERVFEPFHRLHPRSNGSGLGLNLVREVVERHGGRVWIDGGALGGTRVRVELPPG